MFAFIILMSACQHGSDTPGPIRANQLYAIQNAGDAGLVTAVEDIKRDLQTWQAPQKLAGLDRDGEVDSDQQRLIRYRDEQGGNQLTLTLYGLPGGWDAMPANRAIAGQYGQIRQQRMDRAFRSRDLGVQILHEIQLDLGELPSVQAQLAWQRDGQPSHNEAILLVLDGDIFIRVVNSSREHSARWLLQQSKRALAEFRAAQAPH